ncbi:MAG: hypothetical protein OEM91_16700, partial [Hyphomicrobiales bacterium]|nr:hypothetical protein [Hyphomicrobiales bacterium]
PLKAWQQARNSAELARGSFFHQILEADVSADFAAGKPEAVLPLTLQKLEYIRRYHIELQYAYYCGRGRQHAASDKTKQLMLWLSGGLILIAAIPTAHLALQWIGIDLRGLPFLSNLSDALRFNLVWLGTAFVAINIIAISLQSSIEKTFRINNDAANARRYHETAKRLSRLYRNHLPRLRRQAADDNLQPLRRWFTCCNYIILDEHLQWRREAAAVTDSLEDVNALAQAVHPTMPQK